MKVKMIGSGATSFARYGMIGMLAVCASASALRAADYTYTQDFNSPLGGLPTDWNIATGFASANGIAQIATIGSTANNGLYQERTNGGSGNSWVYYTGSFTGVSNGILSDFSASAVFRGAGNGFRGMVVRAQANAADILGYYIGVNRSGGTTTLEIRKDPTNYGGAGTLLASEVVTGFVSGTDYRLFVSAADSILTGSLYGWSIEDSAYTVLLQTVTATDSTYDSGLFGLRSGFTANTQNVYWSDLSVTVAVPEASTTIPLLLMASLVFALWRRRR